MSSAVTRWPAEVRRVVTLYQHHTLWQTPCTSTKWCCGGPLPLSSSIVVVPDELMQ